jgi:hypothetical protein
VVICDLINHNTFTVITCAWIIIFLIVRKIQCFNERLFCKIMELEYFIFIVKGINGMAKSTCTKINRPQTITSRVTKYFQKLFYFNLDDSVLKKPISFQSFFFFSWNNPIKCFFTVKMWWKIISGVWCIKDPLAL